MTNFKPASEPVNLSGPHEFYPLDWWDKWWGIGQCRSCYLPKTAHPVQCYVTSRPLGEPRSNQRTFIYCRKCDFEMIAGGQWIGTQTDTGFEVFKCNSCGRESVWDFDTPAPMSMEDLRC